jgi:hypothetical protein
MTTVASEGGAPRLLEEGHGAGRPLLRSSFRLRGVELRDRFVFQPHSTAMGLEGRPSMGRRSEEGLYLDWAGRGNARELHRVGDCVAPRLLREVIRESYEFGWAF